MHLMYSPLSPFARKVRVLVVETGLADTVEMVEVATSPIDTDPALAHRNPLGKLPALIRDDGRAVYDSRVICRYLDALSGAGLYPDQCIWELLTLEATADGIMEATLLVAYEMRFREEPARHEVWMRGQRDRVARALDALGDVWMSHLGGRLNIGQIAVACALGYVDLRLGDMNWRQGRADLADWYARFATRDSMIATAPQG